MRKAKRISTTRRHRKGLAVVELAVSLPLMLMITFGVIESCNLIYFKQSLTVSAYEGVRGAISLGGTAATATDRAQQVLTDRGIAGAAVETIPTDPTTAVYGEYVQVRVTGDYAQNAMLPGWFFGNRQVEANISMMKEF